MLIIKLLVSVKRCENASYFNVLTYLCLFARWEHRLSTKERHCFLFVVILPISLLVYPISCFPFCVSAYMVSYSPQEALPLPSSVEFLWSMFSLQSVLREKVVTVSPLPNRSLFSAGLGTSHGRVSPYLGTFILILLT